MRCKHVLVVSLFLALCLVPIQAHLVKATAPMVLIDYPLEGAMYRGSEVIELNASDSYDQDGKTITVSWKDNVDGTLGTGTVLHVHMSAGGHTITCEVTNSDNEKASAIRHITVQQVLPPVAYLEIDKEVVQVFEIVTFSALKSSDPNLGIVSYYFDFGDGYNTGWMPSSGTSHSYSAPSVYTAKVTVKNNDGKTASASVNITVRPRPLVEDNTLRPDIFLVGLVSALVIIIVILIVVWRRISIRANRESQADLVRKLRNPKAYRSGPQEYDIERRMPPSDGQARKVRQPVMKESYGQPSSPRKIKAPIQREGRQP